MCKKSIAAVLVTGVFWLLAFSGDSGVAASEHPEMTVDTFEAVVVLELFTSQGCSSCPEADALLKKAKEQGDNQVFALSYHVDYWNYIGWADPFSQSQYAEKQRRYNAKFDYKSNYTPEMVINGRDHFVGSDASRLYSEIRQYKKLRTPNSIAFKQLHRKAATLNFSYGVSGDLTGKTVRAVLVLDERTTKVARGENKNRSITNSNIVIAEKNMNLSEGSGEATMAIPGIVASEEKISLILLVEDREYAITAAAGRSIDKG